MNKVKIIIPIYRTELNQNEIMALDNNINKLSEHPIAFIIPENLDISEISAKYPKVEIIQVSDEWLGTKNGIDGYNRMMMSEEFYRIFKDYEYIFICHIDSWIFRDEVNYWCDRGYDIVAPPWSKSKRFYFFPFKQILSSKIKKRRDEVHCREIVYDHIGNGGLSLRKVASCLMACQKYSQKINEYIQLSKSKPFYYEDVFFALEPKEFNYPDTQEAVFWGADIRPEMCLYLTKGQLPMGCHGYARKKHRKHWEKHIPIK